MLIVALSSGMFGSALSWLSYGNVLPEPLSEEAENVIAQGQFPSPFNSIKQQRVQ